MTLMRLVVASSLALKYGKSKALKPCLYPLEMS